jgi:hypothetical protein
LAFQTARRNLSSFIISLIDVSLRGSRVAATEAISN